MIKEKMGDKSKRPNTRNTRAGAAGSAGCFLIRKGGFEPSPRRHLFSCSFHWILSAQDAFFRQGGIYRSDVVKTKTKSWVGTNRLPLVGPVTRQKNASGGPRPSHRPR